MGLFNKLFGKTIYDFFMINIKEIPNSSFTKGLTQENNKGIKSTSFSKKLNYLECGIFDTIKVITFPINHKNIFFEYFGDRKGIKIEKLKELVNSLFLLNGLDDLDKGKFTDEDLNDFLSITSNFSRNWNIYSINQNVKNTFWLYLHIENDVDVLTLMVCL